MSGFVGFIGARQRVPEGLLYVTASESGGPNVTLTIGAPPGIEVGMLMVACVEAGAYSGGGGPYTFTPDPAWTPILENPDGGFTSQIIANLYAKIADANDEAGTSSYSWSVVTPSAAGMAMAILGWETRYGTTIDNPDIDYSLTPSISSPGGRWQLAYIVQRTASAFVQPQPDPVVTSTPVTLVVEVPGNYRSGVMRVYISNNASPIVGEYLQGGIDFNRQALVVAAVS